MCALFLYESMACLLFIRLPLPEDLFGLTACFAAHF